MKIQKKDGRIEEFDKEKLRKSVLAAGATQDQAQLVTSEVENWLYSVGSEEIIGTQAIRNKVIDSLAEKNPKAVENYRGYKKQG